MGAQETDMAGRAAPRGRPRGFDRDAALRAAMEVFWRRGYEGASVSDLTQAMGINAPSLYAAFGCKEALFREAVRLYQESEGAGARRAMDEAPDARAMVEAMLRANIRSYTDPAKPPGCMVVLAAMLGTPENAKVCGFLTGMRKASVADLKKRLDRHRARGTLPRGADTAALAQFYATVLQGLSIQARDGASRRTLDRIADGAMAAWDGLVGGTR